MLSVWTIIPMLRVRLQKSDVKQSEVNLQNTRPTKP
jgi:hypothetical protein